MVQVKFNYHGPASSALEEALFTDIPFCVSTDGETWRKPKEGSTLDDVYNFAKKKGYYTETRGSRRSGFTYTVYIGYSLDSDGRQTGNAGARTW